MKKYIMLFVTAVILSACSLQKNKPEPDENLTICDEPRPQICTAEYVPVCGQNEAGERKTYATGCTACSDTSVRGYRRGSCE